MLFVRTNFVQSLLVVGSLLQSTTYGQCLLSENAKLPAGPAFTESWAMIYQLVAVSGDRVIVGSPNEGTGTAYIYRRVGTSWVQEQKLGSPPGGALFGAGVSLTDDVAVVGAPNGASYAGLVYVYRRTGTTWSLEQTLSESGTVNFGGSVSVDGPVILVGAGLANMPGRAYIYRHNGSAWVQEQLLTPTTSGSREAFGQSVSLDGNVALVGCPLHNNVRGINAGSMYVFRFNGSTWMQEQELIASDGAPEDYFGWKVSLKGNLAVAGAQNVDSGDLLGVGAAYIFEFNGSTWVQAPRIMEQNLNQGENFGTSVAVSDTAVFVGTAGSYTSGWGWNGLFRIYRKDGSSWYLDRTMGVSQRSELGYFVAVDGERAILGSRIGIDPYRAFVYDLVVSDCNGNSHLDAADISNGLSVDCLPNCIPDECELANASQTDCNSNSILDVCDIAMGASRDCNFNFLPDECDMANGSTDCDNDQYLEECPERLSPPLFDPDADAGALGWASHLQADVSIIGAPSADHPPTSDTGKAIVYRFNGARWTEEQTLFASDGETGDGFGKAVWIAGDVAIVGAPDEDHDSITGAGAVYVFRHVGDAWVQETKLMASDGEFNDHFGNAVAIEGDLALVGAYLGVYAPPGYTSGGTVYAFRYVGGTWVEQEKLGDITTPGGPDEFGISVAMDGTVAAIGAHKEITPNIFFEGGVAHVYRHNGTSWVHEAKVWPPDPIDASQFGWSVAIDDSSWLAVASTRYRADGKFYLGAVYLFRFNNGSWVFYTKLTAPDGEDGDGFGASLGLDGEWLVIGASGDDNQTGLNAGSAYLYHWDGLVWNPMAKSVVPDAGALGASVALGGNNLLLGAPGYQSTSSALPTGAGIFYGLRNLDCNANALPDHCELYLGLSEDCQNNGFLDDCDIISGSSEDINNDLVPDECNTTIPVEDATSIKKVRFVSFSVPASVSTSTALRVRPIMLHHVDPPYSAGSTVPFTSFEGQELWVGLPTQYVESAADPTSFYAANLQCSPHYQDWSTVGLLHVTGEAIVPSSSFDVENMAASCAGNEESCTAVSAPLTITTTRWGDVAAPYNPPADSTQPDTADISSLVNKFRSAVGAPIKARAMLAGAPGSGAVDIAPDVGFTHISACVDAFKGAPYPYKPGKCTGNANKACATDSDCSAVPNPTTGPCVLCP